MHGKHRNVAAVLLCSPVVLHLVLELRDDTSDALSVQECHDSEVRPLVHEVPVRVDRVWLRELFLNEADDCL